jgi:hypothetical protein
VRRADNLTTFLCRLSRISGASTSRKLKGLSRPVVGKLYLYLTPRYERLNRPILDSVVVFVCTYLTFKKVRHAINVSPTPESQNFVPSNRISLILCTFNAVLNSKFVLYCANRKAFEIRIELFYSYWRFEVTTL